MSTASSAPLTMRAVIGKPDSQTYFFTDRIKEVTYNPYWNVPRSIVINEMLPKLWRNPSYLDRLGYEVSNSRGPPGRIERRRLGRGGDQRGRHRRAPAAGPGNALGPAEDRFSQQTCHLHARHAAEAPVRARASARSVTVACACEHPREMAAALLGISVADVDRKIARGETADRAGARATFRSISPTSRRGPMRRAMCDTTRTSTTATRIWRRRSPKLRLSAARPDFCHASNASHVTACVGRAADLSTSPRLHRSTLHASTRSRSLISAFRTLIPLQKYAVTILREFDQICRIHGSICAMKSIAGLGILKIRCSFPCYQGIQ